MSTTPVLSSFSPVSEEAVSLLSNTKISSHSHDSSSLVPSIVVSFSYSFQFLPVN